MEFPKRKPNRLEKFDYSSGGYYFITICTLERRKIPHYVGTLKRFCNKEIGENIFQRSYHDHIIRNETDYRKIYEYIESNPSKWQKDSYYG